MLARGGSAGGFGKMVQLTVAGLLAAVEKTVEKKPWAAEGRIFRRVWQEAVT